MAEKTTVVRLQYMNGFQCLGDKCPDTCCGWWTISIDQPHYNRLGKVLTKSPEEKALFEKSVKLLEPKARTRDRFALLVLNDQHYCNYLSEEHLCKLHAAHGEALLPDGCAAFPKVYSRIGSRVEVTGEPSCPEIARRLLLDENAIVLENATAAEYPRVVTTQSMSDVVDRAYIGLIDEIRGTLYRLMARHDYSAAQKLHIAMYFATQIDRLTLGENADAEFTMEKYEREVEFIERADVLADLTRRFAAGAPPTVLVMRFLLEFLAHMSTHSGGAATLYKLMLGVNGVYEGHGMAIDPSDGGFFLTPEPLLASYLERRAKFEPQIKDRLELYLRNYLSHQVLHEWYTKYPTLFQYLTSVAVLVSLFRFLLLSHPQLEEAIHDPEMLDRIAVDVFYGASRTLEHNDELFAQAMLALVKVVPNLASSSELLKL